MRKSGKVIQTFDYAKCKSAIDNVDVAIAHHFGIDDFGLDFTINFDLTSSSP